MWIMARSIPFPFSADPWSAATLAHPRLVEGSQRLSQLRFEGAQALEVGLSEALSLGGKSPGRHRGLLVWKFWVNDGQLVIMVEETLHSLFKASTVAICQG